MSNTTETRTLLGGLILSLFLLAAPFVATGETAEELYASIRASLERDPRSGELTPQQFDALVMAVAERAEAEGLDSAAIMAEITPIVEEEVTVLTIPERSCGIFPRFFCVASTSFGFGPGVTTPLIFWGCALLLIILLSLLMKKRYGTHPLSNITKRVTGSDGGSS
jgi:hypothetical protein